MNDPRLDTERVGEVGGEPPCSAFLGQLDADEPTDAALARAMLDLSDAVVICDAAGSIVFWNAAATRLFGWSALEMAGKSLELIVPERLWGRHAAGYAEAMRTGQSRHVGSLLEVPALHRDGHTLSIAFSVTMLRDDRVTAPIGVVAVIRDDTARRQALRAALAAAGPSGEHPSGSG